MEKGSAAERSAPGERVWGLRAEKERAITRQNASAPPRRPRE
jgi:hypothetical protein